MAQFPSDFSNFDSTCTLFSYLDLSNISNQHQTQNMEEIDNDEVMEVPDTPDRLRGRRYSAEESSSPLMGDCANEFSSSLMGDFESSNSNNSRRNHVKPSLRNGNSTKKLYTCHTEDSNFCEQSNKVDRTYKSLLDSPTPSSVSAYGRSRRTMGDQVFKVPAAPMPSALPRDPRGSSNVLKFGGGSSHKAEVVASAHKYLGNEIMKNTVARNSRSRDTGSFTHSKIPMERLTSEDDNTDLDSIVRGDYAGMRQGAWSHGALKDHPIKDVKKGDMRSYSLETSGADLDHKEDIVSSQSKADQKAINKNTGRRRLIAVRNGCISPSNTAMSKHKSESHVSSSNFEQGEIKVISNSGTLSREIHSLASSSAGNQSVRLDKGKGKMVMIDPPHEKEYKSKVIPGRCSISIKNDNGISSARYCELKRPEEIDGWRSTRRHSNTSSEMPGFPSPARSSQQSFNAGPAGPENETRDRLKKITKRQRKHSLLRSNLEECCTSDFDDSEITYIGSSGEPATARSTRSRVPRRLSTSCPIVEVDESPEIRRGRPEDSSQMVDGDLDARLRQMEADEILARQLQEQLYDEMPGVGFGENDASLVWRLQQQEQPQHLSIGGQHRSTPRDSSMSHLYGQCTSQSFVDNSVLPANRSSLYTRTARLRNNHQRPQTVSSSRGRQTQFPSTVDIDSRMRILEALEALSERGTMTMASHFLQIQRDFNENDYEMLLALDDNNHQHVGASVNQINGLPQSTVQCIDQWLRRSTSCPVCKSGINFEGSVP
ncbi:uncharacterized protein LOC113333671 isoform X2 [Papaver somniferum]|uniref:uncharacterized protein LOC113333671 isoform X2 n=1 Tax=Papaver somniferum TaxID=3469 RepID=UPI000E6F63B2|nr:uncharacterized protein LOC113333671 isoform X2 [Papaver somniferum]